MALQTTGLLACTAPATHPSAPSSSPKHDSGRHTETTESHRQPPARPASAPSVPGGTSTPAGALPSNTRPPSGSVSTIVQSPSQLILATPLAHSISVGSPIEGSLRQAVHLPASGEGFIANPAKETEARFATVHLAQAIIRAARTVHNKLPGSKIMLGDIALVNGGPLPGHGSHQNGRDIDVMFYLLDAQGASRPGRAIPLDLQGNGTDYKELSIAEDDVPVKIDVGRTWAFIEALLIDEASHVQRIFVVEHIRNILLEHAQSAGASKLAMSRFSDVTCQPKFPHDDHLHIRFFCLPSEVKHGCLDMSPIYPWHRKHLREAKVRPALASRRSKPASTPKLTSVKEARQKAGPMHADVVEFLDRRRAWVKKPHPGRTYCR